MTEIDFSIIAAETDGFGMMTTPSIHEANHLRDLSRAMDGLVSDFELDRAADDGMRIEREMAADQPVELK